MSENSVLVLNSLIDANASLDSGHELAVIQQAHRTFDHLKSSDAIVHDTNELNHHTARRYITYFENYSEYTSTSYRKTEAAARVATSAEKVFVQAFALGAYVTQSDSDQDPAVVETKKQKLTNLMARTVKSVRNIGWEANPENDPVTRSTKLLLNSADLLNDYRGRKALDKLTALADLGLQQGARSAASPFVPALNG